jgi:hypothetical protein
MTIQLSDEPIARDRFVRMQRIAEKGEESIIGLLNAKVETDDNLLDGLTEQLYAWGSDLGLVGGARPQ